MAPPPLFTCLSVLTGGLHCTGERAPSTGKYNWCHLPDRRHSLKTPHSHPSLSYPHPRHHLHLFRVLLILMFSRVCKLIVYKEWIESDETWSTIIHLPVKNPDSTRTNSRIWSLPPQLLLLLLVVNSSSSRPPAILKSIFLLWWRLREVNGWMLSTLLPAKSSTNNFTATVAPYE